MSLSVPGSQYLGARYRGLGSGRQASRINLAGSGPSIGMDAMLAEGFCLRIADSGARERSSHGLLPALTASSRVALNHIRLRYLRGQHTAGWMEHLALGRHFFADGGAADWAGGLAACRGNGWCGLLRL